ncbi:hypothetical protein T07_13118 [Trichinella nelsoni]|uniref:Uncharacterized protein n=1 Tax=Trichinella nelsoni TaxID=6336 RepID=A0A0V0RKZ0_9BILA|nr:hypothetical protein T07_13118 [Trichinella nelsoni]
MNIVQSYKFFIQNICQTLRSYTDFIEMHNESDVQNHLVKNLSLCDLTFNCSTLYSYYEMTVENDAKIYLIKRKLIMNNDQQHENRMLTFEHLKQNSSCQLATVACHEPQK